MFKSQCLLVFSICSHVAKLSDGLMGKDQKNKFLLPLKSWILFIFNLYFLLIVFYKVIFSMTIQIQHQRLGNFKILQLLL